MNSMKILTAAAVTMLAGAPALQGQLPTELRDYPLATLHKSGDLVAPFFDGWFDNGDGTVTYAFGFLNRNTEEIVDVPLGRPRDEDSLASPAFQQLRQHVRELIRGSSSSQRELSGAPEPQ